MGYPDRTSTSLEAKGPWGTRVGRMWELQAGGTGGKSRLPNIMRPVHSWSYGSYGCLHKIRIRSSQPTPGRVGREQVESGWMCIVDKGVVTTRTPKDVWERQSLPWARLRGIAKHSSGLSVDSDHIYRKYPPGAPPTPCLWPEGCSPTETAASKIS